MEKLTLVEVVPRWEGDAAAVLGWPDESWDEYATACVEHVDLHPAGQRLGAIRFLPIGFHNLVIGSDLQRYG